MDNAPSSRRRLILHAVILLLMGIILGGGVILRVSRTDKLSPGRNLRPESQQVEHIKVTLSPSASSPEAVTENERGTEDEPSPLTLPVASLPVEKPRAEAPSAADGASKEGLQRGNGTLEIRGTLLDENGQPVPFAKVEIFDTDMRKKLSRLQVETDEKGNFRADCPWWSHATFTAHQPGHGRAFYGVTVPDPEHLFGATTEFVMRLTKEAAFTGVLEDSEGRPIPQATLRFHPFARGSNFHEGRSWDVNLLNGQLPPDLTWDERCRKELFLTDCEVSTNLTGAFRVSSLLWADNSVYLVEVIRESHPTALIEMRGTRKPTVKLQVPR